MSDKNAARQRRVPMRQCTGCGERKDKRELIRIIRTPEDEIAVDFTGKKNGRGAYICNLASCLQLARKRKSLERSLKVAIPEEIYDKLEEEMMGSETK